MKLYIGIDNGLDGAICGVREDGSIAFKSCMPVIKKGKGREVCQVSIQQMIPTDATVLLEEASKHSPGVLALCSTWFTFGCIVTVLKLNSIKHLIERPQKWQKEFWAKSKMAKGQKFDTKAAALRAANQIWPGEDFTKSERSTKAHDGIVDALLMAEYARRKNL